MKVLFLNALLLLAPCGIAGQSGTPDTGPIEEVYLAKDDGEGKAGEQVTQFSTTDVPIYCVVLLNSDAQAVVKMTFVAVNVTGVRAETKVVTATYTTKEGQNRVNFTGRPDGRWMPGKYRVDLFVNGKLVRNLEFDIKGAGAAGSTSASYLKAPVDQKPKPPKRPRKP